MLWKKHLKKKNKQKKKVKQKFSFFYNLLMFFLKFLSIVVVAFELINYVFRFSRNRSLNMQPALEETSEKTNEQEEKVKQKYSFFYNLLMFFLKLLIIVVIAFVLTNYVFGFSRNRSLNMQPALQDGDLLIYFQIADDYAADDIVIIHYQGNAMPERVAAVAGDTVDIGEDGLTVNGALLQEEKIYTETYAFENEVTFPLTVPQGQIFVLGDNRPHATDSRVFGCISTDDVDGKVVGLFRRRNF